MENIRAYFLDTYALIEIIKDNQNFKKFGKASSFTSLMNILELHYIISKSFNPKNADKIAGKLNKIAVEITFDDVKEASKFRIANVKKKFSYIDCLGYAIAKNKGLMFLTGDNAFKGMSNVEFVK